VNVTDFDDVEIPEGDMLQTIFDGQLELIAKYHDIEQKRGALVIEPENFGRIDHRFVQWRIKDLAFRMIEEMTEATNTLKNKPWKQSEVPTDQTHFYEELADSFHFFIELCITAGLTAEDLARMYHRKHAVNKFRQRSNY
jgi:dimeric dUTPase (all-alpha-NTP-PPase superfamily)